MNHQSLRPCSSQYRCSEIPQSTMPPSAPPASASTAAAPSAESAAPDAQLLSERVPMPIARGKSAPNRLLKAPMEELLASLSESEYGALLQRNGVDSSSFSSSSGPGSDPNSSASGKTTQEEKIPAHMPLPSHLALYRAWAKGKWGIVVTGNVAVDPRHLGTPFDNAMPPLLDGAVEKVRRLLDSAAAAASSSPSTSGGSTAEAEPRFYAQQSAVLRAFTQYARAVKGADDIADEAQRPLAVMQLVHAGRQSLRGAGRGLLEQPWAPSCVPMRPSSSPHSSSSASAAALNPLAYAGKLLDHLMWGTPHALTLGEIEVIKAQFLAAAYLAKQAGFDGVELHASHGYMLAAFLSPKTNTRTDAYGADARGRARLLLELVSETRAICGKDFIVGVKLNSADYVAGGLTEEDALQNVRWLAETRCCDLVEVSGGNYENAAFMSPDGFDSEAELQKLQRGKGKGKKNGSQSDTSAAGAGKQEAAAGFTNKARSSGRSAAREAFFASFATRCRTLLTTLSQESSDIAPPVICITGGLKTRAGMASAVRDARADMAGVGRYACLYPSLPLTVLDGAIPDADAARADPAPYSVPSARLTRLLPLQLIGAGWGTAWHSAQLHYIARGEKTNARAGLASVVGLLLLPASVAAMLPNALTLVVVALLGAMAANWDKARSALRV